MKNDENVNNGFIFGGKLHVGTEWQTELWKKNMFCSFVKLSEPKKKSFESRFHLKCIFCTLWDSPHLFIAGFENNRHKRIRIPPWLKRMSFLSFTFLPKNKLFSSFPGTQSYKAMCRLTVNAAVYFFFTVSLSSFFLLYFVDDVASVCWLQCWALILLELCPYPVL